MKPLLRPREYVRGLCRLLARHADPVRAVGMSAYMRDAFAFHGIMSEPRTALLREYLDEHGLPSTDDLEDVVIRLWKEPHREAQYAAVDILRRLRRNLGPGHISLAEHCIRHKSWWDTVDVLAPHVAGTLYAAHTEAVRPRIEEWIHADDFWLNRSAIILQLGYKDRTDTDLLTRAIRPHLGSREFFLRKAIGWALRQYSYTDARWVTEFVASHDLSPLSEREALKALRRTAERAQRARR
ncbi:MAG: DNA alkylation repair protein [Candidatus Kapaibacterium sp.]